MKKAVLTGYGRSGRVLEIRDVPVPGMDVRIPSFMSFDVRTSVETQVTFCSPIIVNERSPVIPLTGALAYRSLLHGSANPRERPRRSFT